VPFVLISVGVCQTMLGVSMMTLSVRMVPRTAERWVVIVKKKTGNVGIKKH